MQTDRVALVSRCVLTADGEKPDEVVVRQAVESAADVLVISHKGLTYSYSSGAPELKVRQAQWSLAREDLGSTRRGWCRH